MTVYCLGAGFALAALVSVNVTIPDDPVTVIIILPVDRPPMALLPKEAAELAEGPLRNRRGRQAKGEGGQRQEEMIRFLIVIRCLI